MWKMIQVSGNKGRYFLDNNLNIIEPTYSKGRLWLKHFSYSNLLYARAMTAIVNHTPIGKYHLKFFPQEDFMCLCGLYMIETRKYILHKCKRYNNI